MVVDDHTKCGIHCGFRDLVEMNQEMGGLCPSHLFVGGKNLPISCVEACSGSEFIHSSSALLWPYFVLPLQ